MVFCVSDIQLTQMLNSAVRWPSPSKGGQQRAYARGEENMLDFKHLGYVVKWCARRRWFDHTIYVLDSAVKLRLRQP